MATYTFQEILDNELDPGSPMNQSLFTRLARNWQAAIEGANGAPRIWPQAFVSRITYGTTRRYFDSSTYNRTTTSWEEVFAHTFIQFGSVRLALKQRGTGGGLSRVRVQLNGTNIHSWDYGSSSFGDRSVDIGIATGDRLRVIHSSDSSSGSTASEVKNIELLTSGEYINPFQPSSQYWIV